MSTRGAGEASFEALSTELIEAIDAWTPGATGWTEEALDSWARRAFQVQYEGNAPYRRYCEARGVTPAGIDGWRDFVPVPTAAFRAVDLIVGSPDDADLTFVTSGTTRGAAARGRHLVRSTALYRSSLRAAFHAFVRPADHRSKMVTLPPSFTFAVGSSLGWMLDDVRDEAGTDDAVSVAVPDGIDWAALDREVGRAQEAGRPVCVLGTTLGFAEWMERLSDGRSASAVLADGSLLMDTGGVKGRAGLERPRVMRALETRLGVPESSIVNEFGMTELLSQRYGRGDPPAPLLGPPWLRSRVLDPVTLEELPVGEVGLLCHFDLANLGSVCAVLTEDRGRIVGDGIEWMGRTEGAPPRGCSLATAELLDAQADA